MSDPRGELEERLEAERELLRQERDPPLRLVLAALVLELVRLARHLRGR